MCVLGIYVYHYVYVRYRVVSDRPPLEFAISISIFPLSLLHSIVLFAASISSARISQYQHLDTPRRTCVQYVALHTILRLRPSDRGTQMRPRETLLELGLWDGGSHADEFCDRACALPPCTIADVRRLMGTAHKRRMRLIWIAEPVTATSRVDLGPPPLATPPVHSVDIGALIPSCSSSGGPPDREASRLKCTAGLMSESDIQARRTRPFMYY